MFACAALVRRYSGGARALFWSNREGDYRQDTLWHVEGGHPQDGMIDSGQDLPHQTRRRGSGAAHRRRIGARRSARLHGPDRRGERDALIAATALVHGMAVVTRNVADFKPTGASVVNPWEPSS
jgi:hypothetical protein